MQESEVNEAFRAEVREWMAQHLTGRFAPLKHASGLGAEGYDAQLAKEWEQELAKGNYLSHMTRHMLGLFQNMQGARAWRRHLSENACKPGADIQVVLDAMAKVPEFAPADAVE